VFYINVLVYTLSHKSEAVLKLTLFLYILSLSINHPPILPEVDVILPEISALDALSIPVLSTLNLFDIDKPSVPKYNVSSVSYSPVLILFYFISKLAILPLVAVILPVSVTFLPS